MPLYDVKLILTFEFETSVEADTKEEAQAEAQDLLKEAPFSCYNCTSVCYELELAQKFFWEEE